MRINNIILFIILSSIIFSEDIQFIKSQYLGLDGIPSHETFLRAHGIEQQQSKIKYTPYFSVSFSTNDISNNSGIIMPNKLAKPFNVDVFLKRSNKYISTNRVKQIWDGRVYESNNTIIVGGYSLKYNEQSVGTINNKGFFMPSDGNKTSENFPILAVPSGQILFDPFEHQLLRIQPSKYNQQEEFSRTFLPFELYSKPDLLIDSGKFSLSFNNSTKLTILNYFVNNKTYEIANGQLKESSLVKRIEGYQPLLIDGATQPESGRVITFIFEGNFNENIKVENDKLILSNYIFLQKIVDEVQNNNLQIDGNFDEWRNIKGISDPEGDFISYLFPNPDTDILDFKVSNDDTYLYFYSRVVGAHGRTGEKGRYYWYTYIDVDMNSKTGYPPTRDDNCYFGIEIGDDCEAQFEFIGNKFIKTFFGFTGVGTEKEVLDGNLILGPSFYSSKDNNNNKRDRYKVEYVHRNGIRSITHDYTEGSSEDINIALSPDGSEVEMRVELNGFLWDRLGNKIIQKGQYIHIAVGVEASSDYYEANKWGADSSPVIYSYKIK